MGHENSQFLDKNYMSRKFSNNNVEIVLVFFIVFLKSSGLIHCICVKNSWTNSEEI